MTHAEAAAHIEGRPGDVTTVHVGHPHPQTGRYIEVIAAMRPPRTLTIFHGMDSATCTGTYRTAGTY